jgi:hypothetical protein
MSVQISPSEMCPVVTETGNARDPFKIAWPGLHGFLLETKRAIGVWSSSVST